MERRKIKEILRNLGMSEKLLEMPAVMERIYNCKAFSGKELNEILDIVTINDKGKTIIIKGGPQFTELEEGGAMCGSAIKIDQYGMDESYKDEDMFHSTYLERTEDGKICITSVNDSIIRIDKDYVQDDGDVILNVRNYTALREGATPTLGWEGNKLYLTKVYPITKEWFEQREKLMQKENTNNEAEISEEVEIETEEQTMEDMLEKLETQKEIIKALNDKKQELAKENKELNNKNIKLQNMLDRTLAFCETVQKSKFGKFFFRKQLQTLPQTKDDEER